MVAETVEQVRNALAKVFRRARPSAEPASSRDKAGVLTTSVPSVLELESRLAEFPVAYREAFSLDKTISGELVVSQEKVQGELGHTVGSWRGGGRAPRVAVVAEAVGGKTTFLEQIGREIPSSYPVRRLRITHRLRTVDDVIEFFSHSFELGDRPRTLDELTARVSAASSQIVVLDDTHNLMLRAVGLAPVLRSFLAVLSGTWASTLWVVAFNELLWRRLDYQFGLRRYFTDVLRLTFLDREGLREALTRRHQASGLPLRFLPDTNGETTERDKMDAEALATEQEALADQYFRKVYAITEGNLRAAMFCWLMSARYDDAEAVIELSRPSPIDVECFGELDQFDRFTLAELAVHTELTPEEHGEIFLIDPLQSQLVLQRLHRYGLVEICRPIVGDQALRYRLNSLIPLQVTTMLEGAHILY